MSNNVKFRAVNIPLAAAPTLIHAVNTNIVGFPHQNSNFQVQSEDGTVDVYIGDNNLTAVNKLGLKFAAGSITDVQALDSRGSAQAFNFTKMYYVGGPFTLILQVPAE